VPTGDLVGDPNDEDSVLDNDIDPDHDALTASKLSDPSHGDLTFDASGSFVYQSHQNDPAVDDNFLYETCDIHGACVVAVVSITIGNGAADHAPIVVDDAIQVAPGQAIDMLIGDLNDPASVLDNDTDPDAGDALIALKTSPLLEASGDLTFHADGTFTYKNNDALATSDMFLYEACDSIGACAPGVVSISIKDGALDQAPTPTNDGIDVAPHGSANTLIGGASTVLANDTDPDPGETATLVAHLIAPPQNGHVTLNPDGTFSYVNDDPTQGVDSFQYEACDIQGACVAATVSITIDGAAPTVTCVLPKQVDVVGDTVSIDLSRLFAPPPGQTLTYGAANVPPSLAISGSLLTGTLQPGDAPPAPPYTYDATLTATAGGASASENVTFQVLPTGEVLLRDGFDGAQSVQQPCN
jgi:VCBS repeat-containing protein